jgi:hypothetical protein
MDVVGRKSWDTRYTVESCSSCNTAVGSYFPRFDNTLYVGSTRALLSAYHVVNIFGLPRGSHAISEMFCPVRFT